VDLLRDLQVKKNLFANLALVLITAPNALQPLFAPKAIQTPTTPIMENSLFAAVQWTVARSAPRRKFALNVHFVTPLLISYDLMGPVGHVQNFHIAWSAQEKKVAPNVSLRDLPKVSRMQSKRFDP
jgi:hypothetical protein